MTVVMQALRWGGSKEFSQTYMSGLYTMLRDQAIPFWSAMLNDSVKFESVDLTDKPVTMLGKLSCAPTDDERNRIAAADSTQHTGTVLRMVLGDFSHCQWGSYFDFGDIKTSTATYIAAQTNVYVVQMERQIGAALGLSDSSASPCVASGFSDKNFSSCKNTSWAVSYDLMGDVWDGIYKEVFSGVRARTDLLNIHNRWWLGLIAPGEIREVWSRSAEVNLALSSQPNSVHGLYFNVDGAEYLAEYRRTYYGAKGIAIFRLGVPTAPTSRKWATAIKPTDAAPSAVGGGTLMQKGDVFFSAGNSLTVEVLSLDAMSATLRVIRTDRPSAESIYDAQAAATNLKSGSGSVYVGNGLVPITKLTFTYSTGTVEFARDLATYSVPLTELPSRPEWSDFGAMAPFSRTAGNLTDLTTASRLTATYADGSTNTLSFVSLDDAAKPTPSPMPSEMVTQRPPAKAITCVKGKLAKRVVGSAPKCPAGWKKK